MSLANLQRGHVNPGKLSDFRMSDLFDFYDVRTERVRRFELQEYFNRHKLKRNEKEEIYRVLANMKVHSLPVVKSNPYKYLKRQFNEMEMLNNVRDVLLKKAKGFPLSSVAEGTVSKKDDVIKTKWLLARLHSKHLCRQTCKNLFIKYPSFLMVAYSHAVEFMSEYRNKELEKFKKKFPSSDSIERINVNLYEAGKECGVAGHCDMVSYCTVVIALQGDEDEKGCLYLTKNRNERNEEADIRIVLKTGDIVVFGRIFHMVERFSRSKDRLTLQVFF